MRRAAAPHEEWLDNELRAPEFAAHYLTEAFTCGQDEFLVALGNVVRARATIQKMAAAIGKTRPALHRAFGAGGNPGFDVIFGVLRELDIVPAFPARKAKATARRRRAHTKRDEPRGDDGQTQSCCW